MVWPSWAPGPIVLEAVAVLDGAEVFAIEGVRFVVGFFGAGFFAAVRFVGWVRLVTVDFFAAARPCFAPVRARAEVFFAVVFFAVDRLGALWAAFFAAPAVFFLVDRFGAPAFFFAATLFAAGRCFAFTFGERFAAIEFRPPQKRRRRPLRRRRTSVH